MNTYADVAAWAEGEGLCGYNATIALMEKSGLIPGYESPTFELYKGVGQSYGYDEELCRILDAYVSEHGDGEILIV